MDFMRVCVGVGLVLRWGLTQDTTAPIFTELEWEGGSLRRNLVVG